MLLLLSAFFKNKLNIRSTIRLSNHLNPDQDLHSVGPDLGPGYLSVDDVCPHKHGLSIHRVKNL